MWKRRSRTKTGTMVATCSNGGPGREGGRSHPSEMKFLRTMVVVDVPVPNKDRDDGGNDGGSGSFGSNK